MKKERELFGKLPCPSRLVPEAELSGEKGAPDVVRQVVRILRALARAQAKGRRLSKAARGQARVAAYSVSDGLVTFFDDTEGIYDFAECMAEEYLGLAKENERLRKETEGAK